MAEQLSDWKGARWRVAAADPSAVAELRRQGLSAALAHLLVSRGLRQWSDVQRFLQPDWSHLHDPFLMSGMDRAVARIHAALARQERILLYGDYDVDGTSSVVILYKALEALGGVVTYHVPHRLRDGYGMRPEVIEQASREGVTLVISVDTGIRAAEVVQRATACGVDMIITDHHLADAELPAALAILNPHQPGCAYPEKELCGAGVTFKLIQALLARSDWPHAKQRRYLESMLKMAALATVADVVPLHGENRVLVHQGLAGFHEVRNPGLRALLRVADISPGSPPTAGQVGFRLGPRINAAGRMDDAQRVIRMFLTDSQAEADEIAQELHLHNQTRQATEKGIIDAVIAQAEQTQWGHTEFGLVFANESWHRGVVGIVATRIVERYHRPTLVLGIDNGIAQGSGRSIGSFDLHLALESMRDLFHRFGGHHHAAGVTLDAARIPELRQRFGDYARQTLSEEDVLPEIIADAELTLSACHDATVTEILSLEPFGQGNRQPQFLIKGLEIAREPVVFGDRHLRFSFTQGGAQLTAKAWQSLEIAPRFPRGAKVDAIVVLEEDSYSASRGYGWWSAAVRDLRLA